MEWLKDTLVFTTRGKGMYSITVEIENRLRGWGVQEGMCFLFIQHTSASLAICEDYDPSAKQDVEAFMEKFAPENQAWYRHNDEGPDDSPSHIRSVFGHPSLDIPVDNGRLCLGTWQGVFLFEHRGHAHQRHILIRSLKV